VTREENVRWNRAGYVGRPDQTGRIGVFRRDAVGGERQHVLPDLDEGRAGKASSACRE
jgi:hypothetical protein